MVSVTVSLCLWKGIVSFHSKVNCYLLPLLFIPEGPCLCSTTMIIQNQLPTPLHKSKRSSNNVVINIHISCQQFLKSTYEATIVGGGTIRGPILGRIRGGHISGGGGKGLGFTMKGQPGEFPWFLGENCGEIVRTKMEF